MGYYALNRAVHGMLLALAVSVFTFALLELAPGTYFDELKGNPNVSPETIALLNTKYGLEQSLPLRYGRWLKSAVRGDLGLSLAYNTPVAPLLLHRARNTLILTGLATLMAWLIAITLGVWTSAGKGVWRGHIVETATSTLLVIPNMILALAFLWIAVRTHFFPVGGMTSPGFAELSWLEKAKDLASHLALPVAVLAIGMLPVLIRHVRSSMAEVLGSPFIRAARAHGIPSRWVLMRYALPAAANPLISLFGLSLASLLSTSMLVEVIMGWPGIGPLLLEAIVARDVYVVIGAVMLSSVLVIAANLLADFLLYAADPRIRAATS
jgi:peptide/nickel transport system permease protein